MAMMGFRARSTEGVLAAPQALLAAWRKPESGGEAKVKMLLLPVWGVFRAESLEQAPGESMEVPPNFGRRGVAGGAARRFLWIPRSCCLVWSLSFASNVMVMLGAGGELSAAVTASPAPTWSSAGPPAEHKVLSKAAAVLEHTGEAGPPPCSLPGGRAAGIHMGKNRNVTWVTVGKPRKVREKEKIRQGAEEEEWGRAGMGEGGRGGL